MQLVELFLTSTLDYINTNIDLATVVADLPASSPSSMPHVHLSSKLQDLF